MFFVTLEEHGGRCAIFVECTAYYCGELLFGVLGSVNCTAYRKMMYHLRLPLYRPDNLKKSRKLQLAST